MKFFTCPECGEETMRLSSSPRCIDCWRKIIGPTGMQSKGMEPGRYVEKPAETR